MVRGVKKGGTKMADVILGGQTLKVDNPISLLQMLLSNKQKKDEITKKQTDKDKLLKILEGYNLGEKEGPPKAFEELGRRYQGTTGEYDEGGYPVAKFTGKEAKPQVGNLRQLVDVIQGLKGLPQEYAGSIVSRLTGIPDASKEQTEALVRLRAQIAAPQQQQALEQKQLQQQQLKEYRDAMLTAKEGGGEKQQKINILKAVLGGSTDMKQKQVAAKMLMEMLMSEGGGEGGVTKPSFTATWSKK